MGKNALYRDDFKRQSIAPPLSCPAKAGHPVITESLAVTGSPAFAGDDDEWPTIQPKIIPL